MCSKKLMISKGQVSTEYMLLLLAFFSALMIILPVMSYSTEQLRATNDSLLAKQISSTLKEEIKLFDFLSDESRKEFEYIPSDKIILVSNGRHLLIKSKQKTFKIEFKSNKFKKEFKNKFKIIITKNNNKTQITFS